MAANLKLFCNNPNLKNLNEFANFYKIRFTKDFTLDVFFEYNKKVIFNQLSIEQLQEIAKDKTKTVEEVTADDITKDIELPCPCYLYIMENYISYSLIAKNTNFQAPETSVIAFEDREIRKIIDNSYFKSKRNAAVKYHPGCRVIGWFKSLHYNEKRNSNSGESIDNIYDAQSNFIDLSPLVISLNTNVGEQGGTFSITFPHIPVYGSRITGGEMDIHQAAQYGINAKILDKRQWNDFKLDNNDSLFVKSDINSFDYLEWLIQANDLLFLSFDDMEDLQDDNLAGRNFDMIGLVDTVTVTRNGNGSVNVSVSGRDLMKIIVDDSSVFFPSGVSSGVKSIFDNTETVLKGGDLDSVMRYKGAENIDGTPRQITGLLNVFASEPNDFSIDFVLKTVVSHLANLQIVPDDLFINWGEKRTKFSLLKPSKAE